MPFKYLSQNPVRAGRQQRYAERTVIGIIWLFFFFPFSFVLCYNVSMNENTTVTETAIQESMQEICHILTTSDEKLAYDFIECLFTPAERRDIANRWLLVKEIDKGTTQREIAKKFGMSLCKITRGSKELAKPDSAFRRVLDSQKQ